jgi:hypothetical protein
MELKVEEITPNHSGEEENKTPTSEELQFFYYNCNVKEEIYFPKIVLGV